MRVGIGIDTGGTCTDAVAFDFDDNRFLAKGKSLTTRENLSIGIGKALDMIPAEYIKAAEIVSLSTTLATNASLEDKGCRAKLLIFGQTEEFVQYYDNDIRVGIQRDSYRTFNTHTSYDGLKVDIPDWGEVLELHGKWLKDADALATSELFAFNNGAKIENGFKELAEKEFGLHVTCASELTEALNVQSRGATALLNARLLPIVREFVGAAMSDFEKRGCKARVMVVRSDGSLMSSDFSLSYPVESILSGPAASVLAGKSFCDTPNYVIVDMGGTSTDISVVLNGKPVVQKEGVHISRWQTTVKGVQVTPFALGGDSTIRHNNRESLELLTRRSTPICVASTRWPEIKGMLQSLLSSKHANKYPLHEILYLVKEPAENKSYSDSEKRLIEILRKGPCIVGDLEENGIDIYFFSSERLESEGTVMRCGITPTDFMHIKGDYREYDREASVIAAKYLLMALGRDTSEKEIEALTDEVYEMVEGRMYENILSIILQQKYPKQFAGEVQPQAEFLIREAWKNRKSVKDPLISHAFSSGIALVGVGAPTHIFLPAVAEALGAQAILPEHANVANALGALMADISVNIRVEVQKVRLVTGEVYYIAHLPSGSVRYELMSEALKDAVPASREAAILEARSRGAEGELDIKASVENRGDFGSVAVTEIVVEYSHRR